MTTTILRPLAAASPIDARVPGLRLEPVRAGLWRVTAGSGDVRGHIEHDGGRYTARLALGGARSRVLGEFWSAQHAADCFA